MELRTVLAVDDCKATLAACAFDLGTSRHVLLAHDVATARELVRDARPDLAIIDQRLGPHLLFSAGLQLVDELKRAYPEMLVVSTSGLLTDESQRLAYQRGADLVVEKIEDRRGRWIPVETILARFEKGIAVPALAPVELRTLYRVGRDHMVDVLRDCDGDVTEAARVLGLSRWTLHRNLTAMLSAERGATARRDH